MTSPHDGPGAQDDFAPGDVIAGRYVIVRLIGIGGMSSVYHARQRPFMRHVALKIMHPHLLVSAELRERFFREAETIQRLHHPNTITALDHGVTPQGSCFIAMRFIDAPSLSEVIAREGELPIERAVPIAIQIAQSLGEAHDKQIVHRDVKPENVLISERDGEDFATVLDFGVAKLLDDDSRLTLLGSTFGTPLYISPEQARNDGVGPASDLYSLGCTLYEMLVGEPPFSGGSPLEVVSMHLNDTPPPLPPWFPVPLQRFVARTLEKNPRRRPPSAERFIIELLACFTEVARRAAPPPLPRPSKPSRVPANDNQLTLHGMARSRLVEGQTASRASVPPGRGEESLTMVPASSGVSGGERARLEASSPTTVLRGEVPEAATPPRAPPPHATVAPKRADVAEAAAPQSDSSPSALSEAVPPDQPPPPPAALPPAPIPVSGPPTTELAPAPWRMTTPHAVLLGAALLTCVLLFIALRAPSTSTDDHERPGSAAAASRDLVIDSRPQGARVIVDELEVGETPLKWRAPIGEPLSVELVSAGYSTGRVSVDAVSENTPETLFVTLDARQMRLILTAPIDRTEVRVGDIDLGMLLASKPRELVVPWPLTPLTITLDAPRYAPLIVQVTPQMARETLKIRPEIEELVPDP